MLVKNKIYSIYGLVDPFTGEIKYIGKTSNSIKDRLCTHIWVAKTGKRKNLVCAWIVSLLNKNQRPITTTIDTANSEIELNALEISYIKSFRENNIPLKNQQPGGDGQPSGYIFKKRFSPPKGIQPDNLKKYNGWAKGTKKSKEQRLAQSLMFKGKLNINKRHKIVCKNLDTGVEVCFRGVVEAAKELKLTPSQVSFCARGISYRARNYTFRYFDKSYPDETRIKKPRKKVGLFSNFELVKQYGSVLEASRDTKLDRKRIDKLCKKQETHNNYVWKFL